MKIRPYTEKDIRGMLAVAKRLHPIWSGAFPLKTLPIDFRYQRGFVAACGGKIAGFVSCSSEDGIPCICKLGVDPARQHKGIGKKLVAAAEKNARKTRANAIRVLVMGWTSQYNRVFAETRAFYRSLGYSVAKRHPINRDGPDRWRYYTLEKKLRRTRSH